MSNFVLLSGQLDVSFLLIMSKPLHNLTIQHGGVTFGTMSG